MFLLVWLLFSVVVFIESKLEFVAIITSYNNEHYYKRNLDSIVQQQFTYPLEIIYVDDCSIDKTKSCVKEYISLNNLTTKITFISNIQRVGALENLFTVIHTLADHKIVMTIDGDDFLPHEHVFERIAQEYKDSSTWLTYGQIQYYPEGCGQFCELIPLWVHDTNSFRSYKWVTSQLRTFKAGLFKKIRKEDLLHNGTFYSMAWDLAIMFPMLEMASLGHIKFIPEITYLYNHHNPISDHNVNLRLQQELTREIYTKKPYDPLISLE